MHHPSRGADDTRPSSKPRKAISDNIFERSSLGGGVSRRVRRAGTATSTLRNQEKSRIADILRKCSQADVEDRLHVTFIDKDGDKHTFEVAKGDNLLDIAQANDIEMEGACGGSCACSTCHVIVESDEMYDKIPEASDDENDMLDLAFGLTETSRLGCQVHMAPELDGLVVKLPSMTRNMQASDFEKR
ncbi:mitochondrial matrix iron-sulfur protein [Exophiala xenobiotica]|nr:mitochondrial matrix iron-sulfur protein [Exophiala xenobiotica]KAK5211312.1 mitochondrial matrix iron-sulfur protein [Exophiala xenobiotica]KAK5218681.1 mitochondrial matrix iron-sulfur protein [Exophiala xenobiotica]KAK5229073.1 mitochondrial matrix iron-sulfur protein [Exophiala xenobiotica]KAK5252993.1 mitochondrial matrix iron-sulfur protein [Exophiala xenobiotica]